MLAYLLREHFTTFLDVCEQFAQNIKRPWGEEYESPPVLNARTDDSAAWAGFQAKTLPISKSNSDIMLHIDVIHQELCCPVCQIWKFRIPQTFHFIINAFVNYKRRYIQFFPRQKIYFQVRLLLKSKDLNLLIRLPWKILSSVSFAPSLGQFLVGATERWNKVSNFSRCDTSYFFYSYSHCSQTSHTMYYHLLFLLSTLSNVQLFTSLCLALYNVQCSSHGWLQVREDRAQEMFRAFQINFC